MKVTLISTVKDCAHGVDAFLASLAAQTRAPDEVVIVDGGSTDGTAERFAAVDTVTLIVEAGANIARGRNVALAAATHDVIAVTDELTKSGQLQRGGGAEPSPTPTAPWSPRGSPRSSPRSRREPTSRWASTKHRSTASSRPAWPR